ncbi:GA15058-PA [methanotrophic endosymbiont of Bathymodiolus azoricus (Menez Gwen)]|nr:GA15058-PA [methanotrophic endosymbiont of Bathymodiolus azoricus (Menez Gwen)]
MKPNSFIKLFFFTILIFSNLTLASSENTDDVPSSSSSWPSMVAIYHSTGGDWKFQCGASLIDKNWVLTAASCMKGVPAKELLVIINEESANVYRSISEIIIHAEYSRHDNDYAMLKIKEVPAWVKPIQIKPIQLAPPYPIESWYWGTTQAKDKYWSNAQTQLKDLSLDGTVKVHELDLTRISNSLCSNNEKMSGRYGKDWITDNMICAGQGLGKKETCDGTSGGPLIMFRGHTNTWMHLGVSSFGGGCAPYGVYARTSKITRWVSDLMCSNEEVPDIPLSLKSDDNGDKTATIKWSSVSGATGYHLNYWTKNDGSDKSSLDLKENYFITPKDSSGKSFYVTVNSYKNNCLSKETKEKYITLP